MTRPIIETRSLIKTYGMIPVLRKLNLAVARGQFVALLGPNGSGKSTLLRLLAGLSRPTAGQVFIGGWELPGESEAVRAQIGMVSHKTLLYDTLTARENLRFTARLYNLPAAEIDPRIDSLLERVGLLRRGDHLVRTFSRGMQQRLSIARALLHEPHVLLFDEPYTGLDQNAAAILDEMLREAHNGVHTIVMSTHQLDRAALLADRVMILDRGQIGYDAPCNSMDVMTLAAEYAAVTGMAAAL
jgi:heme exporter protein A